MKSTTWSRYEDRIRRVIEYIHENPAADLSNAKLAEIAYLSTYHWHRIYRSVAGETAVMTVRRVRLTRASSELVRSEKPVKQIGRECGYPELHSFTRAFTKYFGLAPAQFRQRYSKQRKRTAQNIDSTPGFTDSYSSTDFYTVKLEHRHELLLRGVWCVGDYMTVGTEFEKLAASAVLNGWMPDVQAFTGIYLDDPAFVSREILRSFIAIRCDRTTVELNKVEFPEASVLGHRQPRVGEERIYSYPGGLYAILLHRGPHALLEQAYSWLYSVWLPASGYEIRDLPCSENYLNSPNDTVPDELLTEVCVPLAKIE